MKERMMKKETWPVVVDGKALHDLLSALIGPPHYIHELQVIHGLRVKEGETADDPIGSLLASYNDAAKRLGL